MKQQSLEVKDIPYEVLAFKMQASFGFGVGVSRYQEMIDKYPEWFPEEVTWRDVVPAEVKDVYFKLCDEIRKQETRPCPFPEVKGLGIIKTSEMWCSQNPEERNKIVANDKWFHEQSEMREILITQLYNKTFERWGLKK